MEAFTGYNLEFLAICKSEAEEIYCLLISESLPDFVITACVVTTRLSQPTISKMMKPTRSLFHEVYLTCGLLEINRLSEPKLPNFRGSGSEQQQ